MAEIDSRNARLAEYTEVVEDIREKIKEIADNTGESIVLGTDTPYSLLGKIEGKPMKIATAEEMNAVLVSQNVGKVYLFVGTTDANYTNGDLYVVEETEE